MKLDTPHLGEIVIPYSPRRQWLDLHTRTARWAIIVAHRRSGKALDVDTPILMANGQWSIMGKLKDGDMIFAENGKPCTVLKAHPVMHGRPCRVITFSDGAKIICDIDHLWHTQTKLDRARHRQTRKGGRLDKKTILSSVHEPRQGSVKATSDIEKTVRYGKENNHSIALAGPLSFPKNFLPIEPYMLGLWLGDGTSRTSEITSMDAEIVGYLNDYAKKYGLVLSETKHQNSGKAKTYRMSPSKCYLSQVRKYSHIGVLKNKHVPRVYFSASIQQRKALLAGLMDTDGSISKNKTCEITQKNKTLANDILELLRGLGIRACIYDKIINGATYYRITFRPWFNPFKLKRKAERWKENTNKCVQSLNRYIVSVEEIETRPVRCITVDSPNSLYLCGKELIPTHNTVSGVNDMLARALCCTLPEPRFAYVNAFRSQAKEIAWDYFKFYGKDLIVDKNESDLWIKLKNDAKIGLFGADSADNIRGKYLDGVFADEYQLWAPGVWSRVLRPMLADRRGWGLMSGTPMGKNSFWKMWEGTRTNPAWFRKMLRSSESGILSPMEIAEIKNDPEVTPEDFAQEFECDFSAAIIGAYYGRTLQDAEVTGRIKPLPYDPTYLVYTGWDLGRNDHTTIWCAQMVNGQPRIINCYANRGQSIQHYIGWLKSQGYTYAEHYLPHDGENEYLIADGTVADAINKNHIGRVSIIPRTKSVISDINKVRVYMAKCLFDASNLGHALEMLRLYRSEWKEKEKVLSPTPKHDESSHFADGFRTLIMGFLKFEPSGDGIRNSGLTYNPNSRQNTAQAKWDIFRGGR